MNELMNQQKYSVSRTGVTIENRERISVTGIVRIDSFDESEVCARVENSIVSIFGQGLHISRLDLDNGVLIVDGFISGVEYSDQENKGGFLGRLFK
ncbi:MAG: sporulation protein YabP [Clostridia bacterium]|nr:sporulation protein YabP [Clostridia bacterium]